ncbi:MAG: BAX inhibitor (BI)-1/YccA family protein, partial [Gammaproteobacteria bacterium]|nr:BAX inhibitor (BI)-1/YccA family protein [Gammaproteobacteria bacterium]
MRFNTQPATASKYQSALATNTVLRNTYFLLSLTLLFSAAMAGF